MPTPLESLSAALAGRYNVERELGAGGMATVYLARDVKHDRHVALKLLRPELAAVIGAARFLNEIKTTANLQHPHILALHDSGEVEGTVFYVMPYVDGESLRDRLNRERQLPIDEAIRITVEVAGALEYAHQHKVIHRDIKPENILLQGGHALVADFGIALAASRTDGSTRMTETGMSLGTPHYMSPEQAMGEREITSKTDIYALGCVLYEMLVGEPPFTGPTAQAIVGRVMTEEPRSLTTQRRTIPRHVDAAVHRALAKLPADRFATAAAFAEALTNPASYPTPDTLSPAASSTQGKRGITPLVVGTVVALAAIGAFFVGRRTTPPVPKTLVQFEVAPPESVTSMGACCGVAQTLSPDGKTLVFVGVRSGDQTLYRRTIGRVAIERIPGAEGGSTPFFSPDGQWLGFFADGKIKKVSMSGGPPLPIATVARVSEASWGEGDVIVAAVSSAGGTAVLAAVPAAGGELRTLPGQRDTSLSHYAPSFLPGGTAVLFSMRVRSSALASARIGVIDISTGKIDTVVTGTRAVYANGYLVYSGADNTLLAQPFNPATHKTTGLPVAMLDRVALHGSTTHEFTVSTIGTLAYQTNGSGTSGETLRLIGESGATALPLPGRTNDNLEDPAFSPDGKRIVMRIVAADAGTSDLWMLNRPQGTVERFTVGGGADPSWSRDGKRIAYLKTGEGIGMYVKNSDGTGDPQLVLRGAQLVPGSWLPDGKGILFTGGGTQNSDIGVVMIGDTTPRMIVATEFVERQPQLSPDGRWLAYTSQRTGRAEIYVQPFTGDGPRVQVSTTGGDSPRWSPDGRTLYFHSSAVLYAALRAPGPAFEVASRKQVAEMNGIDVNANNVNWDVHPDGKEFLYIDQGGGSGARIVWVLDWPQLVKAMATGRQN